MANGIDLGVQGRYSSLSGGWLWPPFNRLAPPALPYQMQSHCFDYCVQTPPCSLYHFPPPCIGTFTCTSTGGPPPTP